jgi:hypothetical protein
MTFKNKTVTFDLNDIGSQVIDQISSDIYAGPGSILREIIKNAYDAYLPVDADELEEEGLSREIQVSRIRDEDETGHLFIADNGIGQSFAELRANVQISISKKPTELDDATGFRGLGSWAILGAGSNIIITSKTKNASTRSRLQINVRRIYDKMGGDTTLDDILNDPACISFSTEDYKEAAAEHGTTVEIECDGPIETVNGFELNRLYAFTDPNEDTLKGILVATCPIPYSSEGGGYKQIHEVYNRSRYIPTQLSLDGVQLERRLPPDLTQFQTFDIMVAGNVAAIAWYVEDPKVSGVLSIDESKYMVGGPGIQLMRLNVPIGPKNISHDGAARENLLNWYVGEVHIAMADVLPNASGQDLRMGLSREIFIEQLQNFYKMLDQRADTKSIRISLEKHLKRGIEAAAKLEDKSKSLSEREQQAARSLILKSVQTVEEIAGSAKGKTKEAQKIRDALTDPAIKTLRDNAKKKLKAGNWLQKFGKSAGGATKIARKTSAAKKPEPENSKKSGSTTATFQARVATYIPKLEILGLTAPQIKGVLAIIEELFTFEQRVS